MNINKQEINKLSEPLLFKGGFIKFVKDIDILEIDGNVLEIRIIAHIISNDTSTFEGEKILEQNGFRIPYAKKNYEKKIVIDVLNGEIIKTQSKDIF